MISLLQQNLNLGTLHCNTIPSLLEELKRKKTFNELKESISDFLCQKFQAVNLLYSLYYASLKTHQHIIFCQRNKALFAVRINTPKELNINILLIETLPCTIFRAQFFSSLLLFS